MKKSIPIIRERESEAFILGNGREREFPLTPGRNLVEKYGTGIEREDCKGEDECLSFEPEQFNG